MSHDLKSPLTSIRAYTEALLDGVAQDEAAKRRYLQTIHTKEENIEAMVNRLFEFAKMDVSEYPVHIEPLPLRETLRAAAAEQSAEGVSVTLGEIAACDVLADRELLRRVNESDATMVGIDAINLVESGLYRLCRRTVAVLAPAETRVRRIMARDGISEDYARLRISAQKPDEYYRGKCDYELNNGADTAEAFEAEAKEFFERLVESIKEEKAHGEQ